MKIGMILDKSYPPDPRVESEASTLIKNGHQVFLFSLNLYHKQKSETIDGVHVYRYPFSKKVFNKISPLAYSLPFYHLLLRKGLINFIKKINPEVIHVHDMEIAGLVMNLNRQWKRPIILDLHENKPEIMKVYSHVNSTLGRLMIDPQRWKQKQDEFIMQANMVIVQTLEAKEDILTRLNISDQKIDVVPNTIRLEVFNDYPVLDEIVNRYKSKFTLLYIGYTAIRRGIDTLIKSADILKKQIPNLKIVLVGKSGDDMDLKKMVTARQLNNIVEFTGWQKANLLRSYIIASDICLSPLKRNPHHDTTYANKLFQYMACGKPIIVSDCPAQKNVVLETDCGLIHDSGNEEDLARKILYLYKNPEIQEQMGLNGKKAVLEKYNWETASKNLINLYKKIERTSR